MSALSALRVDTKSESVTPEPARSLTSMRMSVALVPSSPMASAACRVSACVPSLEHVWTFSL